MTVGNQYKNAVVQTKADDKKYGREQDVRTLDLIRKCRHLLKKQQKNRNEAQRQEQHIPGKAMQTASCANKRCCTARQ